MKQEFTTIRNLDELRQANIGDAVELYGADEKSDDCLLGSGLLYGRAREDKTQTTKVRLAQHIDHGVKEMMLTDFFLTDCNSGRAFQKQSKSEGYREMIDFKHGKYQFDRM